VVKVTIIGVHGHQLMEQFINIVKHVDRKELEDITKEKIFQRRQT